MFFTLTVNDCTVCIKICKHHSYADDFCLYLEIDINTFMSDFSKFNIDLNNYCNKINSKGLNLNTTKSKAMFIGSPQNLRKLNETINNIPEITVGNNKIEYVKKIKYLGFTFNENFSSDDHISSIIQKTNFSLSKIKHCRNSLPTKYKLQIFKSIINPLFDYCAIVYHDFNIHGTAYNTMRLQVAQNNCIRFICNLKKYDHVSNHRNNLDLLNASNRRIFLICTFIYSYINYSGPDYLNDIFKIVESKTRNGSSERQLVVSKVNSIRGEYLFSHSTNKLWNNLPLSIRTIVGKGNFMGELKNHLMISQNNLTNS